MAFPLTALLVVAMPLAHVPTPLIALPLAGLVVATMFSGERGTRAGSSGR